MTPRFLTTFLICLSCLSSFSQSLRPIEMDFNDIGGRLFPVAEYTARSWWDIWKGEDHINSSRFYNATVSLYGDSICTSARENEYFVLINVVADPRTGKIDKVYIHRSPKTPGAFYEWLANHLFDIFDEVKRLYGGFITRGITDYGKSRSGFIISLFRRGDVSKEYDLTIDAYEYIQTIPKLCFTKGNYTSNNKSELLYRPLSKIETDSIHGSRIKSVMQDLYGDEFHNLPGWTKIVLTFDLKNNTILNVDVDTWDKNREFNDFVDRHKIEIITELIKRDNSFYVSTDQPDFNIAPVSMRLNGKELKTLSITIPLKANGSFRKSFLWNSKFKGCIKQ